VKGGGVAEEAPLVTYCSNGKDEPFVHWTVQWSRTGLFTGQGNGLVQRAVQLLFRPVQLLVINLNLNWTSGFVQIIARSIFISYLFSPFVHGLFGSISSPTS
jgi:hypothetical protein